ncbi:polar amino acid transport system substrate-binding protein [Desulfonatronum thiosulfatophilum]|uniref:Polar amino acid transport system substrate-binding protein n=1 Tax=Desulfonatronum thiosulfatophilum TaxID=617002 RepID=A0A1G6CID4_9BACT|nr:basic amino acid ABC transporter substrate-binding protein [Desulfonatronum thiosulfatophilum]SDB32659.1 polar amino acid transport system substrate-binding protein [Desulfonatronum thiosulfatophilum]
MVKRLLMTALILVAMSSTAWAQRTLVFASDCTWPPMEMMSEAGECVGFGPDLVNAMARVGGFDVKIQNTAWDGIFAGLAMGRYDAISSSVSITEERRKAMDFSDPYFEVKQGVVVQQDSPIKSEEDLAGKTVGAQIGTTGYFAAMRIAGNNAKSYDEIGLAVIDLANGRIDAAIADDAVAADYALTHPELSKSLKLAFLIEPDEPEYLGFAVKKGDEEALTLINNALAQVKASSEYDEIFKKWFGGE